MDELDNNAPIDTPAVDNAPVDTPDDGLSVDPPEPTEAELKLQADAEAEAKADAEAKRQAAIDKRIGKEVAKRAEAERRATELEQRLAKLEQASTPTDEPDLSDFDTFADYQKAMREYITQSVRKDAQQSFEQEQATKKTQLAVAKFQEREAAVAAQYSDFSEVMSKAQELVGPDGLSREVAEALVHSEYGPLIGYKLSQDSDALLDFIDLPVAAQLMRLGALEAEVRANPPQPKAAKVSNAPAPIKPVSANAPAKRDVYSMSDREFLAANGLR